VSRYHINIYLGDHVFSTETVSDETDERECGFATPEAAEAWATANLNSLPQSLEWEIVS